MKKIWVNKAKSFKEAEDFDRIYYAQMTPQERLNIVQELREIYFKFRRSKSKGPNNYASRKRLRRVVRII